MGLSLAACLSLRLGEQASGQLIYRATLYASAVYAVVVGLSTFLYICLSATSRYCIEMTGRIELVFAVEASFHLTVFQGNPLAYLQKYG